MVITYFFYRLDVNQVRYGRQSCSRSAKKRFPWSLFPSKCLVWRNKCGCPTLLSSSIPGLNLLLVIPRDLTFSPRFPRFSPSFYVPSTPSTAVRSSHFLLTEEDHRRESTGTGPVRLHDFSSAFFCLNWAYFSLAASDATLKDVHCLVPKQYYRTHIFYISRTTRYIFRLITTRSTIND